MSDDSRKENEDWKMFLAKAFVAILVGGAVIGGVFYGGYRHGRHSKMEELRNELRGELAILNEATEKEIAQIRKDSDKSVEKEREPLARLRAQVAELEKRRKRATETMAAREFADAEGMGELANDAMRLEQASVEIGGLCRRIRVLHAAFGKQQIISPTIRESKRMHKEISDAHKQIMDDMKYAQGASKALHGGK